MIRPPLDHLPISWELVFTCQGDVKNCNCKENEFPLSSSYFQNSLECQVALTL